MNQQRSRLCLKAAVVGLLAVLGFAGSPKEAPAFQFDGNLNGNGELVLAIFGNNTEYYYDIGSKSTLLAPGASNTFDVSAAFASGAGVVSGPQTQWTIIGRAPVTATPSINGIFTYAASQNDAAGQSVVPAIGTFSTRIQTWDSALLASTGATPSGSGAAVFLNSTDPAAFTNSNNFNLSGTLGGTWNGGFMQGSLNNILNMIQGQGRNAAGQTNVLSDVGQAILTASGQLTICGGAGCSVSAVPVPAAVVLFGSGLAAMVGLARRGKAGTPV